MAEENVVNQAEQTANQAIKVVETDASKVAQEAEKVVAPIAQEIKVDAQKVEQVASQVITEVKDVSLKTVIEDLEQVLGKEVTYFETEGKQFAKIILEDGQAIWNETEKIAEPIIKETEDIFTIAIKKIVSIWMSFRVKIGTWILPKPTVTVTNTPPTTIIAGK